MELIFKNPGLEYMIDGIMMFQSNESIGDYFREPLFAVYPQIDRAQFDALRRDYLYDVMHKIYDREATVIEYKLVKYNQQWQNYKSQIEDAFSDVFGINCCNILNGMVGNITLNPIEPRWLATTTFDVFWQNSERGALGTALHEITHFVWFHVWAQHFEDNVAEYETPHLKWVFSEMVVDPIMRRDSRLHGINPYFAGGCVYDYFYLMKIEDKPILETLYEMYESLNIIEFMERGYEYCAKHEAAIRAQMK